jgi:hypothetical protein
MLIDRKFEGDEEAVTHVETKRSRAHDLAEQLDLDAQALLDGLEDPERIGEIVAHIVQAARMLRSR